MAATVVGLYDDEAAARRAVETLREHGFGDDDIHVEAHGADDAGRSRPTDLVAVLRDHGVPDDEARTFDEGVRRGGSLLILRTSDERREEAARLMETRERHPRGSGADTAHHAPFRQHYETTYADAGRGYEAYEPAYDHGYRSGAHDDYAGRSYEDVRPALRRSYEERHGEGTFEDVKEAVRHGFHRARTST